MVNKNGYYLEFNITRNGDKVHSGIQVTFSSSLNAAKKCTKEFNHRTK